MAIKPVTSNLIEDITSLYRSLPPRPSIEELEAATSVLASTNAEEESKLIELDRTERNPNDPEELFTIFKEVKRNYVSLQAQEQRKEAVYLLDLESRLKVFDELIQRAARVVNPEGNFEIEDVKFDKGLEKKKEIEKAQSFNEKVGTFINSEVSEGGEDTKKLTLIQVASLIESSAKQETKVLNLKGKLKDQIEWLPVSLGKLQEITHLDLSENKIMAIPTSIGNLKTLIKLEIHSNQLINLPESFGELTNLIELDLHANRLASLPKSFQNLSNLTLLDLSSNQFTNLPELIGNLTKLEKLNLETNDLEGLPHTIGSCISLMELRLDFNRLKGLPEAIGKVENLQTLSLHYNRIKGLPTTMANLVNLRELDLSFNELESIPESFCFVTSLVKLDVGRNFADFRNLPRSIGNLEMLEEIDISSDQIRVLPDSFRFLKKLRVFNADETPLEVPPREIVKLGAQAVVEYMSDLVASRDIKKEAKTKRVGGFWFWLCSMFKPGKKRQEVRSDDMV